MTPFRWKALAGLFLAAVLSAPAWGQGATPAPPGAPGAPGAPGTLNYVEGQVNVGNQVVDRDSIASIQLQPGEPLSTQTGKAEILLTPGAFLRVGDNSTVQMVSESQMDTAAELTKGQAAVEVVSKYKHSELTVNEDGATTRLRKKGLYEFDANPGAVLVYKGEAEVQVGGRTVKVKGGHELALNQSGKLKTVKFNKKAFESSDLIQFSGLRSEYLAEANADAARAYYGGAGWYGPGWYWDPAFWAYTWVPGEDYCYDAFGWGFYSPFWVDEDPFFFGGFFGDFGVGSFGHDHFGRHRLPHRFEGFAANEPHRMAAQPPAMGSSAGQTGSGFNRSGMLNHGSTAFNREGVSGFNRGSAPAFNRGGIRGGGFHGGGFAGGGFHGGGHAGGGFGGGGHEGGGSGGGHGGGGFGGGGFGGFHR